MASLPPRSEAVKADHELSKNSSGTICLTIHSRGTAIVPMSVPLTQALGPQFGDALQ